ncbi:hypothetical protein [Massilia alkalitolerans]|uniref:hypothetical protein n=1 Tax=Massilia alkalitolerans TaxID=286638 RepID=UPI0009FB9C37|nr:hypothetical protein [Massilia alkalitolerans]
MKKLTLTLGLAGLLASLPAAAQALADPTRPPAALDGSRLDGAGDGLPRLQSVLIAPRAGGRHVAVIDGETVRLGGSFRGARVARMTENQVELVRGRERQVLRLDPADSTAAGITPAAQ